MALGGCGRGGGNGENGEKILPLFSTSFGRAQKSSLVSLGGCQYCFPNV